VSKTDKPINLMAEYYERYFPNYARKYPITMRVSEEEEKLIRRHRGEWIVKKGVLESKVEERPKLPLKLLCQCGREFEANVYPSDGLCPVCAGNRGKALAKLHGMIFK